ncbi:MAG: T9SS type A sorting domain-containing protein, partial [Chitinophagaceae bacterium]|nr:T9SS type A sorting domain-containing protein [Chitinophagaceae bacterium]
GTYTQTITTERKCALTLTFNLMLEDVNDTVIRSGNVLSAKGTGTAYQWVRCPSFVPISGATAPVFTVVSDGDYALIITKGSCTDTSDCINVSKTGLADIVSGNHAIQLRPNPAQTQTTISFTEAVQQAQIELQTITGITVHKEADFSGKEITVDLQEYPTGLYLVIIKQAGAPVMTMKLLKQ